jgi:hypothetical protein
LVGFYQSPDIAYPTWTAIQEFDREVLENHIDEERIIRRYPTYMQNFERLKNDTKLYWKKNIPEVRKVNIYTTASNL